MYRDRTVGVVIPAYNEEGFVGAVLETLPPYVDRAYVIDDGSSDETWAEIRRTAERLNETKPEGERPLEAETGTDGGRSFDERVVPIRHERNRGVGGAIKTGYGAALADELDLVAVMAGDEQMDPDVLTELLDPIVEDRADYAKATRLLSREFRRGMSTWRFVGNSILSLLTKVASGYWRTTDPQNGYTAISGEALETIEINSLYEYYGYCNHILVKLNAQQLRVADVAIPAIYGREQSGIMYPQYVRKVSLMLLSSFLWRLKARYLIKDFHPLALFYYVGAATTGAGLLGGLWKCYAKWREGDERSSTVGLPASLVLFSLGWLFMLFAMVFDRGANRELEVQIDV